MERLSPEQFCYWLQGALETRTSNAAGLSADEVKIIREHLALVFDKRTPDRGHVEGISPISPSDWRCPTCPMDTQTTGDPYVGPLIC